MTPRLLEIVVAHRDHDGATLAEHVGGAGLLVLPRRRDLAAEASDGALAHRLGDFAAAIGLPVLFSYAEACSGHRHLALQLALADGRATANYRATHLSLAMSRAGWSAGNWLTLTRLVPFTLGLLGGIDHLAPEVGRALSGLDADLLLAVLDPTDETPAEMLAPLVRLRAMENGVPICLVGPGSDVHAAAADGQPIATTAAGQNTRLILPLAKALQPVPRRPELYRQLVTLAAG